MTTTAEPGTLDAATLAWTFAELRRQFSALQEEQGDDAIPFAQLDLIFSWLAALITARDD